MILIGRGLDCTQSLGRLIGEKAKKFKSKGCAVVRARGRKSSQFPVMMAKGSHLFPYRTQKLSPSAPMVLGWTRPGRVGRCRNPYRRSSDASLFCKFYAMKMNYIYLGNASIFHLFIDEIFVFLLYKKNKIRRIITSFRVPERLLL